MRIAFHGGKCCGIKTIHGFGEPNGAVPAKAKTESLSNDSYGYTVNSDMDCFHPEAPAETRLERLDRLLAFIKKWRPYGIVEIALAQHPSHHPLYMNQVNTWAKLIEERGFKEVSSCYNSNSGNRVHIFHLCNDKPMPKAKKKAEPAPASTCEPIPNVFEVE